MGRISAHDLSTYIEDARRHPMLTREAESELMKDWNVRGERQKIRQKLIEGTLRFATDRAMAMSSVTSLPIMEAVAAANFGLCEAARRYDGREGNRFYSYAGHWINRCLQDAVAEQHPVRYASSVTQALAKIKDAESVLEQKLQRTPNEIEVSEHLGWSLKKLHRVKDQQPNTASTNRCGDDMLDIWDVLPDLNTESPDESAHASSVQALEEKLLSEVDPRSRQILEQRMEDVPLHIIGEELGICKERVRQIQANTRENLQRRYKTLRSELIEA